MAMRRHLLLGLAALALGGEARAQAGKGGRRGESGPRGMQRESADVFHVIVEELRIDLKLSPEQQPLWDAYLRKIEALRGDIERERRARPAPPADAPRALDRLVDRQRDRMTAMEDIAEAGKALYRSLDVEQKEIADARLARAVAVAATSSEPAAKPPPR